MRKIISYGAVGLAAAAIIVTGIGAVDVSADLQDQNTSQTGRPFMGRGPGGFGGPMGMLPMLGRQLQLTETQRDQIKAIAASNQSAWKTLAGQSATAHQALNNAVMSGTVDETLIRQQSAAVAAVDAEMAVARAHAFAEVWQILTPDQQTKLNALKAQINARRQSPRGQP